MGKIVIAGGGICGLAAAQMLADDGHRIVVVERDAEPPPAGPDEAYESWNRRGVGQFRLAHWLHARGTRIMRTELPRAYELFDENGGLRFNLMTFLAAVSGIPAENEDDYEVLTGRRAAIEWACATAAEEHPSITVRRGTAIKGLVTGDEQSPGVPHVTGLRLDDGEDLLGDLVIDATGRRSNLPQWFAGVGARVPLEHAEDSGFAYFTRYYRAPNGDIPPLLSGLLTPYGSFSLLVLPADNGTWATTVYGLSDDKALRRVRDPEIFDRLVDACPLHAHWNDGEPLSDVESMAGVVDRHRQFVVDGSPCVTGLLAVGDSSSCTNPSLGRGITMGLMHVQQLRSTVADHLDDPVALAMEHHALTESEMRPWHDSTTRIDRRRVQEMRVYRNGGEPELSPQDRIGDAMFASVTTDALARRSALDILHCLALQDDVMARPGVLDRMIELATTADFTPAPGPDRSELEALLA